MLFVIVHGKKNKQKNSMNKFILWNFCPTAWKNMPAFVVVINECEVRSGISFVESHMTAIHQIRWPLASAHSHIHRVYMMDALLKSFISVL